MLEFICKYIMLYFRKTQNPKLMGLFFHVSIAVLLCRVNARPLFSAMEGQPAPAQYPKDLGAGLKMPGEAMPTRVHLPHETNPTLLIKDSIKKAEKGKSDIEYM